jgi:hypothetical protein
MYALGHGVFLGYPLFSNFSPQKYHFYCIYANFLLKTFVFLVTDTIFFAHIHFLLYLCSKLF